METMKQNVFLSKMIEMDILNDNLKNNCVFYIEKGIRFTINRNNKRDDPSMYGIIRNIVCELDQVGTKDGVKENIHHCHQENYEIGFNNDIVYREQGYKKMCTGKNEYPR